MNMSERQAPLRARYRENPAAAMVTDRALTTGAAPTDPLHCEVMPMPESNVVVPVGVHRAHGGLHDAPTPGDLLCAALAACMDATHRMVANMLCIEIEALSVEVTADVDVRGSLAMDQTVPVGFQAMRCRVNLQAKPGTDIEKLQKLKMIAEHCCIVSQTLAKGVPITLTFDGP